MCLYIDINSTLWILINYNDNIIYMKYCIYQIDDKSNEKVIDILDEEDQFVETIKERLEGKFSYKFLESISENDIKVNDCFKRDYYLLVNKNQIKLVNKFNKVNSGYIYNSTKNAIIVLFIWKLLPFECEEILNNYTTFTNDDYILSLDSNDSGSDVNTVEYVNDIIKTN